MRHHNHVYVIAGCADLTSLESMSLQEKKRQGYIHELIETEEKYMEDLQLVLEVYFYSGAHSYCPHKYLDNDKVLISADYHSILKLKFNYECKI